MLKFSANGLFFGAQRTGTMARIGARANMVPMLTRESSPRQFARGVGYLGRGLGLWVSSPRLMLIGAIPAFIVGLIYAALFAVLLLNIALIATWATPFANEWVDLARTGLRAIVIVALVGGGLFLGIYSFATITLAVGDPLYEKIWRATETSLGPAEMTKSASWWRSLGTNIGLSALAVTVALGVVLIGLIPLLGSVIGPIVGVIVGGWVIALELTGYAFDARGLSLKERRRSLRASRATTLGFGIPAYLLFLVPIVGVIVMPAAVAGATMLARDALQIDAGRGYAGRATPSAATQSAATP